MHTSEIKAEELVGKDRHTYSIGDPVSFLEDCTHAVDDVDGRLVGVGLPTLQRLVFTVICLVEHCFPVMVVGSRNISRRAMTTPGLSSILFHSAVNQVYISTILPTQIPAPGP